MYYVMLEETIFEMDEVIVSTAFNKIQSQNVMSRTRKYKILAAKGTATLIEGLATIPVFLRFQLLHLW
jgi:iron complex outermembrane receptor protein